MAMRFYTLFQNLGIEWQQLAIGVWSLTSFLMAFLVMKSKSEFESKSQIQVQVQVRVSIFAFNIPNVPNKPSQNRKEIPIMTTITQSHLLSPPFAEPLQLLYTIPKERPLKGQRNRVALSFVLSPPATLNNPIGCYIYSIYDVSIQLLSYLVPHRKKRL
jgi:hypothetical protein